MKKEVSEQETEKFQSDQTKCKPELILANLPEPSEGQEQQK
jgi:hypothetical protein